MDWYKVRGNERHKNTRETHQLREYRNEKWTDNDTESPVSLFVGVLEWTVAIQVLEYSGLLLGHYYTVARELLHCFSKSLWSSSQKIWLICYTTRHKLNFNTYCHLIVNWPKFVLNEGIQFSAGSTPLFPSKYSVSLWNKPHYSG